MRMRTPLRSICAGLAAVSGWVGLDVWLRAGAPTSVHAITTATAMKRTKRPEQSRSVARCRGATQDVARCFRGISLELAAETDIGRVFDPAAVAVTGDHAERNRGVQTVSNSETEAAFSLEHRAAHLPCGLAWRRR